MSSLCAKTRGGADVEILALRQGVLFGRMGDSGALAWDTVTGAVEETVTGDRVGCTSDLADGELARVLEAMNKPRPFPLLVFGWVVETQRGSQFVGTPEQAERERRKGNTVQAVYTLSDGRHAQKAVKRLLDSAKSWLTYCEKALPEFLSDDAPCAAIPPLCPKCRPAGCIKERYDETRAAVERCEL